MAAKQGGLPPTRASILPSFLRGNPAAIVFALLAFVMIVMIGTAQRYSPEECKIQVQEAKQAEIERRIEKLRQDRALENQANAAQGADTTGTSSDTTSAPTSSGAFGSVFAPGNLSTAPETAAPAPDSGSGAFGGVFAPGNLNTDTSE